MSLPFGVCEAATMGDMRDDKPLVSLWSFIKWKVDNSNNICYKKIIKKILLLLG